MTAKDSGHHHDDDSLLPRHLFSFLLGIVVVVLFAVLLIFLILRPTKPSFILRDAMVYNFNSTASPTLLTTTIQVTISTRNPNARVGVYYQKLDVYASYRGQQITLPVQLPDSYQGHKEIVEWSPFLYGESVPVSPFLAESLAEDQNVGTVLLNIKVDGKVKWKVGTWVSGKYLLHANCPALLVFKSQDGGTPYDGVILQSSMKFQATQHCNVDV
ncbi:hypothetical protein MLD38_008215 [Melastoma candidum]|uniref:Uncharacterized protein n=1 Tax=Melastoma candidum TaxID=119954 RepID=A0ACB9RVH1_9MYRT|nr:hypothetical protein MLD38_008215 [Melastoma candidum]